MTEERLQPGPFDPDEVDPIDNTISLPEGITVPEVRPSIVERVEDAVETVTDESVAGSDSIDETTKKNVSKSAAMMSAATLTSRVTGFIRTWAIALALGNTFLTSSYQIANNIPNMIYELVAGGLLSTAFLPVLLEQIEKGGKKRGWEYSSTLINLVFVILGVIALVATFFAPALIRTQMLKSSPEKMQLAIWFFRFFAVQVVFYGVGAIISGILNSQRRFLWPAMGPIFNNVVVIITLFAYIPVSRANEQAGLILLAVGTTLGVVAMFGVQIPSLIKTGMKYVPKIDLHDPGLRETVRLAIPAVAFTVANLIAVSIRNSYAMDVSANGPSTLSFAWMWYQFPYGVIAVALSTAIFTELSEAASRKQWQRFKLQFVDGLRTTLFLIIPLAIMLILLARPLVMIFKFGKFTLEDVGGVANVLSWWGLALPFYSAYMFTYFTFSSLKGLKTVAIVNGFLTVGQVALYAILTTGAFGWSGLGLIGIPITNVIFYVGMLIILLYMLRKRIGSFDFMSVAVNTGKIIIAGAVGAALVWALQNFVFDWGGVTTSWSLVTLLVCGIAGLAVIWGLCAVLKVPESAFFGKLFGRFSRKKKAA